MGEYGGWLSLLRDVLLLMLVAQIVHTVFIFSNHQTECGERWFSVSPTLRYRPTTSTAVVLQNSCYLGSVFVYFHCSQPSTLFCVVNQLLTHCKLAMSSKYCSTRHGQVTKRFYNHFPHFHSHKSCFITKFYRGMLFKIFFHGNLLHEYLTYDIAKMLLHCRI